MDSQASHQTSQAPALEAGLLRPGGVPTLLPSSLRVAEDEAVIISVGDPFTVAAGTFEDTVATEETTPLEPGSISRKRYARGVGQIFDEPVELISHEPN